MTPPSTVVSATSVVSASAPTPKTSAIDRTPGETQPREQRKWASNTFAETGSPMFNTPVFGTVVTTTPNLFSSVANLYVPTLATSFASALPTTILPAPTFAAAQIIPSVTTTFQGQTPSVSASNSLAWPSSFGTAAAQGTQWSQASNSWAAPLPSWPAAGVPTSSVTQLAPGGNSGFNSALIHTFSDNLQPGYQAKQPVAASFGSSGSGSSTRGGYWSPNVNPGWNAGAANFAQPAQQGAPQTVGQAPQATISFAGITASDFTKA